ncbi:multicopper oxidase family protein [Actinopolyspora halophila]|uniref:multicopper oxidase family protein n=1 Tax=Actinopolyspora halophila TaxID=1850 RepID=UPI00037E54F0|nr:multicopper oxidase family protein [Actinopolyspora halophila]
MSQDGVSRRSLLAATAGLAGAAAATGGVGYLALRSDTQASTPRPVRVSPSSDAVRRREQARIAQGSGRMVQAALTAEPTEADLGGRVVRTWAYNGQVPGPAVRCSAGDRLEVEVTNRLPERTTVYWHGLRLRNDMDGVPNLMQEPIPVGDRMRYTFTAPDPGTYWLHPHVGLQRERGLHAPLIVDDPREPGDYDVEFVVVLDDWLDDVADSPEEVLSTLQRGRMTPKYRTPVRAGRIPNASEAWQYEIPPGITDPPPGMTAPSVASLMAASVQFPFYLLNGRLPTAPETFRAKPGQRARIRVINAGGTSVFRLALGGHRLTVTHTDGFPVEPVTVDTLHIASGERYDLLVDLNDGAFPLSAVAEGHGAQALGVVRTASGPTPASDATPTELAGRLLKLSDLHATPEVQPDDSQPEVTHPLQLIGSMRGFHWRINGETYNHHKPFADVTPMAIREGQRMRMTMVIPTPMYHPMHLHGHTGTVRATGAIRSRRHPDATLSPIPNGTRKDTLVVAPGQRVSMDFTADNPGQWLVHCHMAYHLAIGMAVIMSYVTDP